MQRIVEGSSSISESAGSFDFNLGSRKSCILKERFLTIRIKKIFTHWIPGFYFHYLQIIRNGSK